MADRQAAGVEPATAVDRDRDPPQRRWPVAREGPHGPGDADRDRRPRVARQCDRGDAAAELDEEVAACGQLGLGERGGQGEDRDRDHHHPDPHSPRSHPGPG
jgi:hypothetical protein